MTDRELLELAAKSAGLWVIFDSLGIARNATGKTEPKDIYDAPAWNPLTDDGDALRLAVRLRLNIKLESSPTYHYAKNDDYEELVELNGCCTKSSECDGDPYAATRLAIVRAAAEIGKGME